jgi:hypothetical protein
VQDARVVGCEWDLVFGREPNEAAVIGAGRIYRRGSPERSTVDCSRGVEDGDVSDSLGDLPSLPYADEEGRREGRERGDERLLSNLARRQRCQLIQLPLTAPSWLAFPGQQLVDTASSKPISRASVARASSSMLLLPFPGARNYRALFTPIPDKQGPGSPRSRPLINPRHGRA